MQPQGLGAIVGSVHWCHTDKHGALWVGTDESGCGRHLSFFLFSSTQREATAFSDTGEKRTRFFPGLLSIFTQVALSPVQGTSPGSPQNLPLWTQGGSTPGRLCQSAEARKKEGGTKPRAQTEPPSEFQKMEKVTIQTEMETRAASHQRLLPVAPGTS